MSKLPKEVAASKAIVDYLEKQNRPYSAVDIFNNLHKEYGKTAVVKTLESLAEKGKIKEKTYGKQKVYVADQSQFAEVDDNELAGMDGQINQLGEKLKEVQHENRKLDSELQLLNNAMTTEEVEQQIVQLDSEISKMEQRLRKIKSADNSVSPEERATIVKSREKYVKAWRKRKRMANDILNAILEGYPKTKKQLYEDIGIETDEDMNVKVPNV